MNWKWHEPPREYLLRRVEVTEQGCWKWKLGVGSGGYGTCSRRDWRGLAHRFAYEKLVAPLPPGVQLDHLCRERLCVNPDHLEPVTSSENQNRGGLAREGRTYSLFQRSKGQWAASIEVGDWRTGERRRKVIQSIDKEKAISRMEQFIEENAAMLEARRGMHGAR